MCCWTRRRGSFLREKGWYLLLGAKSRAAAESGACVDELLRALAPHWYKRPGATAEQLAAVEQALGRAFPADYRTLMMWSDGGEGELRSGYLRLWPLDEIEGANESYQIARYLPDCLAIGSDGGGYCYALDCSQLPEKPALVTVDFGDLDPTSVRKVGEDFRHGIRLLLGAIPEAVEPDAR
jgi:hypothetical protein